MTSRAARDNNIFRLLFMPTLAIGLVVGCAPASSGGGGGSVAGQAGGNVSQGGSTGGPAGNGPAGNGPAGNGPAGNTGNPGGTISNPGGTISNPGGTTSNPGGTTSNPGGTTSNPGGTTKASGGATTSPGGTTSNPGGTTSNPGGTTTSSGGTTKASGGTTTASGGTTAPGGSTGSSAGSTGSTGNPPGYWSLKEWSVSTPDWHGCSQTGIDIVAGTTTSVKPQDFMTGHNPGDPYCVSGTVFNDYNSVALLGFNITEAATSDGSQCKYNPANATKVGPPGIVPTGSGIAINFSTTSAIDLRIQVQGPNGSTDPTNRWCYDLLGVQSPAFAPYTKFNTRCWEVTATSNGTGTFYDPKTPIDAVWFLVPGTKASPTPYSFCINGFAPGNSAADAPKGGTVSVLEGNIGGANTLDANYQRVKVYNGGNAYIIQNNNWGNSGSGQTIHYKDNTFQITSTTGNGSSAPASFPSIYIGENGAIANGLYQTNPGDGLPKVVSTIQSVSTSFAWSGGSGGKDFNATYDVWFSSKTPTAGSYNDAISGFVMVWLYKPGNHQPIGSVVRTANIAGHNWDVWVGPRGTAATGTDGANRPVVSYVSKDGSLASLNFDLNLFIKDAATNGIQSSWYLTDVFAGFEIWTGSDSTGLQCTGFTCVVK